MEWVCNVITAPLKLEFMVKHMKEYIKYTGPNDKAMVTLYSLFVQKLRK